jgi:hypothetical protein
VVVDQDRAQPNCFNNMARKNETFERKRSWGILERRVTYRRFEKGLPGWSSDTNKRVGETQSTIPLRENSEKSPTLLFDSPQQPGKSMTPNEKQSTLLTVHNEYTTVFFLFYRLLIITIHKCVGGASKL